MKFGAMQGVLGEPLPEVLAVARELGFDGIEVDWHDPAEAQEGGILGPEKRPRVRQAAEAAGVEIPSVAALFLNGGGIGSAEAATREAGMEAIRAGIDICRDLGATALLVPFFGAAEIVDAEDEARVLEGLKALAPAAESAGVVIGFEHSLPAARAAEILDAVGSPGVGDYWDMANCMSLGYDPLEEIRALGRRIVRVHAKEFRRDPASAGPRRPGEYPGLNPAPFGEGDVPVGEVLAALRRVGYDGYITLETGTFGNPRDSARAALEVLRSRMEN